MSFSEKLKNLFKAKTFDDDFFDDLTDNLIEGDVGAKTAYEISERLQSECKKNVVKTEDDVKKILRSILLEYVKQIDLQVNESDKNVWMVLGVNGVGKTTSVAKLAAFYKKNGLKNLILASADTFRAAAIEQLNMHGEKVGVRVVSHQNGSDPAAVVFDACSACQSINAGKGGLVIADTAGRLHNKENLVRELQKIDRICRENAGENCYKKIIVLDATTGQNALRQAEVFNEAIKVDAIILTKYDSTAKGGIAISVGKELNIPVAFVCNGEKYENIAKFNAEKYVDEFIGL